MSSAVILAVDDDKTVLDSLKEQLKGLFGRRFRYEMAESASEAWEVMEEIREDGVQIVVVVSDWLMPDTRGDEFLAQVRASDPAVSCILLTGYADNAALERLQSSTVVDRLLHKPWSPGDLRDAIECALGSRTARQP